MRYYYHNCNKRFRRTYSHQMFKIKVQLYQYCLPWVHCNANVVTLFLIFQTFFFFLSLQQKLHKDRSKHLLMNTPNKPIVNSLQNAIFSLQLAMIVDVGTNKNIIPVILRKLCACLYAYPHFCICLNRNKIDVYIFGMMFILMCGSLLMWTMSFISLLFEKKKVEPCQFTCFYVIKLRLRRYHLTTQSV